MLTVAPTLAVRDCPIALWRAADLVHPERGVARSELVRVRPGVYAAASSWHGLRPWEKYLVRVHAVAMLHPDAVFSHESAAVLLGMPVIGDPVTVHVLVGPSEAARESTGIRTHRASQLPALIESRGLVLTTPAATAVTIARHRQNAHGLAVADAAMRLDDAVTRESLVAENETRASSRGRNHARWALERATPRHESALESFSDAAIEWLGFPAPELQHEFRLGDATTRRGDLWWPDLRLLGEPDGEFKYDGTLGDPLAALRDRQRRDRELLANEADAIAHWGWVDVARVHPLRSLLIGQQLPQVRPQETSQLRSLMRLLAPYERASALYLR